MRFGQKNGDPDVCRVQRMPIKILLADDHAMIREGLAPLFEAERGMELLAEALTEDEKRKFNFWVLLGAQYK